MAESDIVTPEEPPVPAETVRLPMRGFTIDRRKALIAAAILWAGYALMVFLVVTERTGAYDRWGLMINRTGDLAALSGPKLVAEIVRDVTALGGVFLRNLFALAAVVALLFLKLRREAFLFAATVMTGWIVNTGMKTLVGRPRPEIVPHLTEAGGASFPSGHSFSSAVVYVGMALAFASLSQRHSVRYTVIGAAMVLSAMVAWSRVMLGVHFPSDVTAGWLGGAGWAFLAAALLYKPARAAADSGVSEHPHSAR
ncbi:undecaprenyl pyrophosphate phosphatase [Tsuneonella dongtanensis]|uniref:Undecaprenyl pyrophosphate phosphatase n=1 Tax=Tsuneonella dongtanensis TaxID=692370 RepID=A0A1B2AE97_9SPHN|nr:phosphatase PAP2 family protein [Tsuneonella dongtanensis]ANY20472.1 undecaprenyl pyrophosphate phosphatase [Tsuneonella dongtanensis]